MTSNHSVLRQIARLKAIAGVSDKPAPSLGLVLGHALKSFGAGQHEDDRLGDAGRNKRGNSKP